MTNLKQRAITGIVLVSVIIISILWSPFSFILIIQAINLPGLLEFYRLFHSYTLSPRKIAGSILSLSILLSFTITIGEITGSRILLINIPLAFGIFIYELYLKSQYPFQNLAFIFLGIICITIPLCFFTWIAFLPAGFENYHPQLILGYFFILWANDTGAFFIGKNFGKRRLFKRVSPNKTWEGSLGGMISALSVASINSHFFSILQVTDWIVIALLITVTGTFGDLVKSLMKRSLNLKDSGTILRGHGGIIDRFDSLLGSAPFVFCYLFLFSNA